MHGTAPFERAAPPWRADDYGGAEVFASSYGAPPYGATARRPWRGGRRKTSRGACTDRAQQAFAELAERRASDRARGGADYYGNDKHEGDDEEDFYVPQTQALL